MAGAKFPKFEEIGNIDDLIRYIISHGIPTGQEERCHMQDIVGHTAHGKLIELAQDDGTIREDGSTWSTGRRGTQKDIMALLYTIWHWEDATRFFNLYVNPIYRKAMEDAKEKEKAEAEAKKWKAKTDEANESLREALKLAREAKGREAEANAKVAEKENEIVRLKAMLFDLMMKER